MRKKNPKSMIQTKSSTRSWKKTKDKNTHIDIRNIKNDNRKINKKRKFPKHIVKTLSIYNKESILKTAWEKTPQVAYKGKPIRKTVDESVENLKTKRVESPK